MTDNIPNIPLTDHNISRIRTICTNASGNVQETVRLIFDGFSLRKAKYVSPIEGGYNGFLWIVCSSTSNPKLVSAVTEVGSMIFPEVENLVLVNDPPMDPPKFKLYDRVLVGMYNLPGVVVRLFPNTKYEVYGILLDDENSVISINTKNLVKEDA